MWIAQLTTRTCGSCAAEHGEHHPLSEDGPLDHHAGRCTRAPITKTYKQLGIDLPEPKSAVQDGEAWFKGLGEAGQRDILGPSKFEAWKSGRFPREQWSMRVKNPGWRDSYVPRPVSKISSAPR